MMGFTGKKYLCYIPKPIIEEESKNNKFNNLNDIVEDILLEKTDSCLYYSTGWWTYEFCFNNRIRQFHANVENEIVAEYTLGSQPILIDEVETYYDNIEYFLSPTKSKVPYVSEIYKHGTKCDLLGDERNTE